MVGTYKVIEDIDGEIRVGLAIAMPLRRGERSLWVGQAASAEDALHQCHQDRELIRAAEQQLTLFDGQLTTDS